MKTIYDVGFHVGQDTIYYLKSGYRVISIEANPELVKAGRETFSSFIDSGLLIILNTGIAAEPGTLNFFVNDQHTEYSSFNKEIASRDCIECKEILINSNTLDNIVTEYGPAYYIKIDIEGFDHIAYQSLKPKNLPLFISIENGFERDLNSLRNMGYKKFNFVDQSKISGLVLEHSVEGVAASWKFEHGSSGPFGNDIHNSPWVDYETALSQIRAHWNRPNIDPSIDGWFDLHASLN
jgi:FkbM family methyltransferase